MKNLQNVCDVLRDNISDVISDFNNVVQREPWLSLPPDLRLNSIPDLVHALLDAMVCDPADEQARRDAVHTAIEHGQMRAEQGFEDDLIFMEYHFLRGAVWEGIQRHFGRKRTALEVISRFDAAITVATSASLRGFHRASYEEQGKWDNAVDWLVTDAPWPRDFPAPGSGTVADSQSDLQPEEGSRAADPGAGPDTPSDTDTSRGPEVNA